MSLSKPAVDSEDEDSRPKFIIEEDEARSTGDTKVLRANFTNRRHAWEWLNSYKQETSTHWISKETKNVEKLVYHEYWKCQLSSQNKKENSKRNLNCPMSIDIKIKKVNKGTIKNDKAFLKRSTPLPAVITIKNSHNHKTCDNSEALGFLRPTAETIEKFIEYFNDGLGPAEAVRLHESKIRMEEDCFVKMANASINPTGRQVTYLHDQWRDETYGKEWSTDPLARLKEKTEKYKERGIDVLIDDSDKENWSVLVVTPIMKRTQKLAAAGEIVFVDTTSSCESTHSSITPVLVATKGGAVPIGIILHNAQSAACYERGFCLLRDNFPNCFGGKTAPDVFMTDISAAEKKALANVWPSVHQLLCHFHVAQSEWRWLIDSKNDIPKEKRQKLMAIFQKIMKALSVEELADAFLELQESGFQNYIDRVSDFLDKKEEWVQVFRSNLMHRGHETNNYAEASIRILKDIILGRTKAFNVPAMVDFIVSVWEVYFENRLLHYAYGRMAAPRLRYENLHDRMPDGLASQIQKLDESTYVCPSGTTTGLSYEVDTNVGWCNCPRGRSGAFCKHQALVHSTYGGAFPNLPAIDAPGRFSLALLALGAECPPFEFFIGLKEDISQEVIEKMAKLRVDFLKDGWFETSSQLENNSIEDGMQLDTHIADHDEIVPAEPASASMSAEKIQESIDRETEEILREITRIKTLSQSKQGSEVLLKALTRFRQRLSQVKNPNQGLSTFVTLSMAASKHTRRGGYIKVQPTGIQRRREGVKRGAKRIPEGRPSITAKPGKVTKRRPHKLSQAIKTNVASVTSHGKRCN